MYFGVLKDGGLFYIDEIRMEKLKRMYPDVNVIDLIKDMEHEGIFKNHSKRSALKLIHKTLKNKE